MDWKTTYPTLETVMLARFETLQQWDQNLPAPQTDVEHTVRRRLRKQMETLAGQHVRHVDPALADKWNKVMDDVEKSMPGLKNVWRM